jgi:hypothetical protein
MDGLLRCCRLRGTRSAEPTQQSIYNSAGLEQLRAGGKQCCLRALFQEGRFLINLQIGPGRGNQRARAVGKYQCQQQLAAPMHPSQQFQRFSFIRMARTNDGYLRGITVEMTAVVGSLSSGLSLT